VRFYQAPGPLGARRLCRDYPGHAMNPEIIPPDGHPAPPPGGPRRAGAAGPPARLAVGIVGAGRAGTALGVALARAGHQVVAASAVSDASLRRARANFPAAAI